MSAKISDPRSTQVAVSRWLIGEHLRPGRKMFAMGDVHGFPGHLDALVKEMAAAAAGPSHLVLRGDLIDRGPDSTGAIATATKWVMGEAFSDATLLIGNHDLFYLSVAASEEIIDERGVAFNWRVLDGRQFDNQILNAWRLDGSSAMLDAHGADDVFQIRDCLIKSIGIDAVKCYEAAQSHIEIGNLLLVHGGIVP